MDSNSFQPSSLEEAASLIQKQLALFRDQKEKTNSKEADDSSNLLIICIDGRCASGKTSLASLLQSQIENSQVIHLDDFFLQPYQRTPKRYATPGRNVDSERIVEEILEPAMHGNPIVYRPFSCRSMSLQDPVSIGQPEVLILEGSYATNSDLDPYADLRILTTIDPDLQLERIEKRNGKEKLQDFKNRWIPLEEKYFQIVGPARFDLVLDLGHLK